MLRYKFLTLCFYNRGEIMKKLLGAFILGTLVLSTTACGGGSKPAETTKAAESTKAGETTMASQAEQSSSQAQ